jgi:prophage regulatory protein
MTDRCISTKELRTLIPYSRQHINRLAREPQYKHLGFPKPVQLGQCRICWWLAEIMEWLKSRPRF